MIINFLSRLTLFFSCISSHALDGQLDPTSMIENFVAGSV